MQQKTLVASEMESYRIGNFDKENKVNGGTCPLLLYVDMR